MDNCNRDITTRVYKKEDLLASFSKICAFKGHSNSCYHSARGETSF